MKCLRADVLIKLFLTAFLTKPDLREHITKEHGEFLPKNVASVSESIRKAKTKEIMKQKVLCTLCGKSFR